MSTKIIAFEGADFSGKSTLAEEMAKSYDFALLVHFPLMNYDISSAFNSMKKTIYDEEFMNNLTDVTDITSLMDALIFNITINNKNQIIFLDELISIQNKGYVDCTCSSSFLEDLRFFVNGKEMKYSIYMLNFWKMMFNRMMIHEKDVKKAIIFDRSIVSTRVYNYIIPNKILDKYIIRYTNDNTEESSKIVEKLKEIKKLIRTAQETAEVCYMNKLNKLMLATCLKIIPFMIICDNSDNVTEFYKQKRTDKIDDYDKNTMIQEIAKKYYDDLYYNANNKTSKESRIDIHKTYEINPMTANMIFSHITNENVKSEDQVDKLINMMINYDFEDTKYF